MDKLIEISLSKIEHGKPRKDTGKTSLLHRHLLVNSLLNRVRCNDKNTPSKESLMNYREPKVLIDMESEEWEIEKIPSLEESSRKLINRRGGKDSSWKQTSSFIKVHENKEPDIDSSTQYSKDRNDNSICYCDNLNVSSNVDSPHLSTDKSSRKRPKIDYDFATTNQLCTKKRCLTSPSQISIKTSTEPSFAVTSLASLFNDMAANPDKDSRGISFNRTIFSTMVAY